MRNTSIKKEKYFFAYFYNKQFCWNSHSQKGGEFKKIYFVGLWEEKEVHHDDIWQVKI